jgi:outer membrane biosynthesis protein TonB
MSVAKLLKQFSKLTDEQKAEVMEYLSDDDDNTEEHKSNEQVEQTQEPQQKEDKSKPEVKQEPKQEQEPQPQPNPNPQPTPQVDVEEDNDFKGIDINQVVLKEDLDARFSAMNAKLDAVLKENADLKDKLADAEKQKEDLHKKYEYDDFGNQAQKEYGKGDNSTPYQSADDYVKQFYNK